MEGLLFDETMRRMPSGQIGEYGKVGVTVTIPESSASRISTP